MGKPPIVGHLPIGSLGQRNLGSSPFRQAAPDSHRFAQQECRGPFEHAAGVIFGYRFTKKINGFYWFLCTGIMPEGFISDLDIA